MVMASKNSGSRNSGWGLLFRPPIKILDDKDDFDDGDYELVLGAQIFRLRKIAGSYLEIVRLG